MRRRRRRLNPIPQHVKMPARESMTRPTFETLERRCLLAISPIPELHLTAAQVDTILGQAASQARSTQAVAVVDREGVVLGKFVMAGASSSDVLEATRRAL